MFSLKGKTAVVTGSTKGIGLSIAELLGASGANVVVCGRHAEEALNAASSISKKTKAKAIGLKCDVSQAGEVSALFDSATKKFGSLDILVNNAGIFPFKPFLEMKESDWQEVLNTNLNGVFLCTQAAAKLMAGKKKGGRIVNVSSIAGFVGFQGLTHYCTTKGGVISFTRAAALELAPYDITVNSVAPGPVETPGIGELDEKMMAGIVAGVPLKRIGQPKDIASAVLYLCSDEASYVTGQTLVVDGGMIVQ